RCQPLRYVMLECAAVVVGQRSSRAFLLPVLLTALIGLAGCGSSSTLQPALDESSRPDGTALPPAASLAARAGSFTYQGLMRSGSAFEGGLPRQNVEGQGSSAVFAPLGEIDSGSSNLAFALYAFGVEDYDRDLNVRLSCTSAPADGQAWLALANFATG